MSGQQLGECSRGVAGVERAMDEHRTQRVSEAIREELSELIGYEMSDPRVLAVDVTDVLVTPDMRHAQVRIHFTGATSERDEALQALDGARSFLRRELAVRLNMFRVPDLHFEPDIEGSAGERLEKLLKRARKGRPRPEDSGEKSPQE